uniref:Uncharacterized protein n=1 Tax=Anguilla anguilla TaxID=7936 RepID=A0A0E9RUM9_ANGAN
MYPILFIYSLYTLVLETIFLLVLTICSL